LTVTVFVGVVVYPIDLSLSSGMVHLGHYVTKVTIEVGDDHTLPSAPKRGKHGRIKKKRDQTVTNLPAERISERKA
jgi:hypothetical protein